MAANRKLYIKARSLRKLGKSYSEISKELLIPKSTLSSWFSQEKWSKNTRAHLNHVWKKANSERLLKYSNVRHKQALARHRRYRREADKEFIKLKTNHLFTTGISLYWGEGEKANQGRVSVINSDPRLIEYIALFYRNVLKIPNSKLRVALFIYKNHDLDKVTDFWSNLTKVPKDQFIKTQVLPSRSKLTKKKLEHGICNLYFSDTEINIKIRRWIHLLYLEMRE